MRDVDVGEEMMMINVDVGDEMRSRVPPTHCGSEPGENDRTYV